MSRVIQATPVLRGADAEVVRRELVEGSPLTPERRAMFALVASVRPEHVAVMLRSRD